MLATLWMVNWPRYCVYNLNVVISNYLICLILNYLPFIIAYGCRQFRYGQLTIVCVAFHLLSFVKEWSSSLQKNQPSVKIIFYRQVPHDETDSGEAGEEVRLFHKDIRSCWRTKTKTETKTKISDHVKGKDSKRKRCSGVASKLAEHNSTE